MTKKEILLQGIIKENPIFKIVLGICSTLAITSSMENGMMMGFAVMFVLLGSNLLISVCRTFIPDKVRIPAFIVIIATFVIVVELIMHAYAESIYKALGIFLPLIVVNCILLGRAEAFASKNTVIDSILDAIGMGIGYFLAIMSISFIRECLGSNQIFGYTIIKGFSPASIFILPPGGFLTIGFLLAFINWLSLRKNNKIVIETPACCNLNDLQKKECKCNE
ncbi:electron transport complex subunit E [Candidatus Desantisbacteria bacterium]|nr:electron transport complex subunit E [Candidatus Desantisbacteria bacterium]